MESINPFAQSPTPDVIVAQLNRQLAVDYPQLRTSAPEVDALIDHTVRELWRSPVKTFVPVLAMREARDALADQGIVSE